MRDDLTAILMILDRSGSMSPLADDTVGGFNAFIEQQKKEPGDALVTLLLFDHNHETVFSAQPIGSVEALTTKKYIPGGNTALLDAVGRGVCDLERALVSMGDGRPGKVIVVIMTDGRENASREYKREQIQKLVQEKSKNYGWSFLFLGANVDAFAEAGHIGVANAVPWVSTAAGVRQMLGVVGACVSAFRSGEA